MNRPATSALARAAILAAALVAAPAALGQAIIHNTTTVKLGVDRYGQLNIFVLPTDPGAVPSMVVGTTSVGVRYMPLGIGGPEAEATSHGCFCEGWGIAATSPAFSARANNAWGGPMGLVSNSFTSTASTAIADCSTAGGELRIVHDFRPSATPNLFECLVTVTNTTTSPILGITYRRNMDWDVEQTAFTEYSTVNTYPTPGGPFPANVIFTSEDGFVDSDPTVAPTLTFCGPIFTDCGPSDHGAQFDLDIGGLAPGASTTFKIYYGAAPSEPSALAALGVVNAKFYSFGQPNLSPPADHGRPNTFIFAFGGRLFDPACTAAPQNMVLWLPCDEPSGLSTDNIRHPTADGALTGGCWLGTSGNVGKAVCFDQGQVTVPHYAGLYLDNDVTMDAWVKPQWIQGPGWKYTIIDKRQFFGSTWRGYWLYLNGTNGEITLEFNDAIGPTLTAVGPPLPFTSTWEHVAVAVQRNCGSPGTMCVTFWHNGTMTSPLSFPGQGAAVGTTGGLRLGDDFDPSTGDNWIVGCIDEVEVFNVALSDAQVKGIYAAGSSGKCKEYCVPTAVGAFYGAQTQITVPHQICNYTNTMQCYTLSFLPATCTPPGVASPVGITTSPSGVICVPPGTCSTVWLTIPRPPFVSVGDVSCYTVCMTNISSGTISCCDASVMWAPSIVIDWPWVDGPIVIGTAIDFGPIGVTPVGPGSLGMPLRIVAYTPDGELDTHAIEINGLPPGVPFTDTLKLKPGQVRLDIPLGLAFPEYDPGRFYRISLEADLDGDGEYEPVESHFLSARFSAEECEPAEDEDFEFHPPGSVCGLQGFIPWQNGNDVCGEVSTEQASSAVRSLKIVGAVGGAGGQGDDTVLPVSGVESGRWTFRCMTYVPSDATGDGALVLLNTYSDTDPPASAWYSAQLLFRADLNTVQADIGAGTTPLVKGQWVEVRLEIDLDTDTADYFYNGVQFVNDRPWTDGVVPGSPGPARLRAIDFYGGEPFGNGTSGMYFDDVSIKPVCTSGGGAADCNENGVDDTLDIAKGTSPDCYTAAKGVGGTPDGIPDECQCIADWNLDGTVNSTDVSDFINTFFADQAAGTALGDINCDGVCNSTDVSDFINLWFSAQGGQLPFAGCTI